MIKLLRFIIIILLVTAACSSNDSKSSEKITKNKDSLQNNVDELTAKKYYLALKDTRGVNKVKKKVFKRNDEIYFIFEDVGKFQNGSDSLSKIEMKMEVIDNVGIRVAHKPNLLGDKGIVKLNNGIAKKPFASFLTDLEDEVGKYVFKVTIYDKISGDSLIITEMFILE